MARVLIVEDNEDLAETLAALLESAGHESRTVNDGLEALREVQRQMPDAVVLDIGLPSLDGIEVARRLRQRYGQALRLIACSAFADCDMEQRITRAGFNVILTKPASLDEMLDAIDGPSVRRQPSEERRRHDRPSPG